MTKHQQEDQNSEQEDTVLSFDTTISNDSKKNNRRKHKESHVDDIVDALLGGELQGKKRKSRKRQKKQKHQASMVTAAEEANLDEHVTEQTLGEESNGEDDVADLYAWDSPEEEPAEEKNARQVSKEEELDTDEAEACKAERQRMLQLALAAAENSNNVPDDMPRDENEWFGKLDRESTAGRKQKHKQRSTDVGLVDEDEDLPTDFIRASGDSTDATHHKGGAGVVVPKEKREAVGKYLAIDCEMVGGGFKGSRSMLARVSIANYYGHTILDTYVVPMEPVTDYRTWISGIRKSDLDNHGRPFLDVQKQVAELIKGRILVGHAIYNDLKVLMLRHPPLMIRDTSRYEGFRDKKGSVPALRHLAASVLNISIQQGEHSSVTDAKTTMLLYRKVREEWERLVAPKLYKQKIVRAKTKERFARLRREIDEADKSAVAKS
ncbi:ribonuclease H-like protein [Coemansia reversa NRRL 1564]|uniref:RNA exonuclease 4 n=1 Tax=Coemansia reversa (strain ATCC 12441 / NRRL 1564) TaxID=763665 RepID=A0A2G5B6G0_COERN|nr:ribonuclease H-like protein [Coemansia reversa NRRL 1564]|eukprot:PIA14595.1 ribonuclease H-like protein [Coemansia reversa NRRL 1564]